MDIRRENQCLLNNQEQIYQTAHKNAASSISRLDTVVKTGRQLRQQFQIRPEDILNPAVFSALIFQSFFFFIITTLSGGELYIFFYCLNKVIGIKWFTRYSFAPAQPPHLVACLILGRNHYNWNISIRGVFSHIPADLIAVLLG